MKKLLVSTLISIGIAAVIFCITGVIFDVIYKGNFILRQYSFSKMVLATLFIGLGFGLPSFIYEKENLPVAIQAVFHLGIGYTVMLIASFMVGWIPVKAGIIASVAAIALQVCIAGMIALIFYFYNRNLAKKMNESIKRINDKKI